MKHTGIAVLPKEMAPLIEAIHAAPLQLVFEFAGAGSLGLYWLHAVAGSSRTLLEAGDRYAAPALADLLGKPPASAVAPVTAASMARRAYARARFLAPARPELLGLACTAAISTDRERRGANRAIVAAWMPSDCRIYDLTMAKGLRDRAGEEYLVAHLIITAIAAACNIASPLVLPLDPTDRLDVAKIVEEPV
jgi:hypothetical protein